MSFSCTLNPLIQPSPPFIFTFLCFSRSSQALILTPYLSRLLCFSWSSVSEELIYSSCIFFSFLLNRFPILEGMANLSRLVATIFSSLSFLSNSFSSLRFNLLRVARCCFSWSSVSDDLFFPLVLLLALSFSRRILSLSFLCSSVSEALFTLRLSFISERFFSDSFSSMLKLL